MVRLHPVICHSMPLPLHRLDAVDTSQLLRNKTALIAQLPRNFAALQADTAVT